MNEYELDAKTSSHGLAIEIVQEVNEFRVDALLCLRLVMKYNEKQIDMHLRHV